MKPFFTVLLLVAGMVCLPLKSMAQSNIEAINKQVWEKFYDAFETLDAQLMTSIHLEDMIRISGGKNIRNYEEYMAGFKKSFQSKKENGQTSAITLRFIERISNDSIASERGIYQMISNKGREDERISYGKFHVLLEKHNGTWKIMMDYDSNEQNTIGIDDFENAFPIFEVARFSNQ